MDSEQKARDAAAALLPYVSPAMSEQDMGGYTSPLSAGEPELALMWLLGYAGLPQAHAPRNIILDAVAALPDDDKDDYAYLLD